MAWACSECGLDVETEAAAAAHICNAPVPEPVPVRTPDELAWEIMNQRQTAALEVIAVELSKVARYLERMAYSNTRRQG